MHMVQIGAIIRIQRDLSTHEYGDELTEYGITLYLQDILSVLDH